MQTPHGTFLLALASGALLALSFPRFGQPAVAWVALVPLLVAIVPVASGPGTTRTAAPLRAWALGLAAGGAYFAGTLYWIAAVMRTYGGVNWPSAVALNGALVAYLALFPALFALIMERLVARYGPTGLLYAPAVWVATELGRAHLFTGFPWVLLGYSQASVPPSAQLASVLGVYGLSALVVLVNATLAYLMIGRGRRRLWIAAATGACVAAVVLWGGARVRDGALTRLGTPLRVGLIQGNIRQEDKWEPGFRDAILQSYLRMTREASARGARFVIWPESSTPFYFEEDPAGSGAIARLAREAGVHLLVGSDELERGREPKYYNAAFLVAPTGQTTAVYRKMHLVPFGEYVPLKRLFFFASPVVEAVSDFSPGDTPVVLPIGGHLASTAICYEVVYPDLIRRFVVAGSELLTTITNDAWYGRSSAPHQHFSQAAVRAIEQGRYLARAANTGISGIVDPYGRVVMQSAIFEPAVLVGDVRFLTGRTVYARIGDLFAYMCVALTAAALLGARAAGG